MRTIAIALLAGCVQAVPPPLPAAGWTTLAQGDGVTVAAERALYALRTPRCVALPRARADHEQPTDPDRCRPAHALRGVLSESMGRLGPRSSRGRRRAPRHTLAVRRGRDAARAPRARGLDRAPARPVDRLRRRVQRLEARRGRRAGRIGEVRRGRDGWSARAHRPGATFRSKHRSPGDPSRHARWSSSIDPDLPTGDDQGSGSGSGSASTR